MPDQAPHHVVVLVLDNVLALDLGIPLQVFGSWLDGPYTLTVCTERPGLVPVHGSPLRFASSQGLPRPRSAAR